MCKPNQSFLGSSKLGVIDEALEILEVSKEKKKEENFLMFQLCSVNSFTKESCPWSIWYQM